MSATVEQPARGRTKRPAVAIGLLALIAFAGADLFLHRGALLDPISSGAQLTGVVVGVVVGVGIALALSAYLAWSGDKVLKGIVGIQVAFSIFVLPFFGGFAGSYYARVVVEQSSFYSISPTHSEIKAEVTGKSAGRGARPTLATVRPYPGGRTLQVRIDNGLYRSLDPWRSPGRDCLTLDVETGRNGVRRAVLPNVFDDPLGLDSLGLCGNGAAIETVPARPQKPLLTVPSF